MVGIPGRLVPQVRAVLPVPQAQQVLHLRLERQAHNLSGLQPTHLRRLLRQLRPLHFSRNLVLRQWRVLSPGYF